MSVTSKQYSVSLSGQMLYIKVHISHKGVSPPPPPFFFSAACIKETWRYEYMVDLTFLMAFLSFSLRTSHGLYWLWQCHCRCGRSRMPEELSDSRYGMCKCRLFIPSWKHIKLDLFYNYQIQLDSSLKEINVSSHVFYTVLTVRNPMCLWLCMSSQSSVGW